MRRWRFIVDASHPDGRRTQNLDSRLTFGTSKDAQEAAEDICKEYIEDERAKEWTIKIIPEGLETVSFETFKQLRGLELDISIQRNVAMEACSRWCAGENPPAISREETYVKMWLDVSSSMRKTLKDKQGDIEIIDEGNFAEQNEAVDMNELQELAYSPLPREE